MKTANLIKRYINGGLALMLIAILGMSPALTFAAGSNRSKLIPVPKREKRDFISKPATRTPSQSQLEGQSTTLLPDGRLLLIGGEGSNGPQASMAIRDPRTQQTTLLPGSLQEARAWHSATVLPDGRVLVAGGTGAGGKAISSAEIYDPQTGISTPLPSSGLSARAHHTATLLTTGQVLIVGGSSGNERALTRAELFDTKTGTAIPLPGRLANARQNHKATLIADGSVLFEGGSGSNSDRLTGAELYNADTRSFSPTTLSSDQIDGNAPFVTASLPADGAADVPVDSRIAVRFSKPLRVETLNSETVKLTSSEGTVLAKVVGAEAGRLVFLTPLQSLTSGTAYTVSLSNASDNTATLTPASISFTTVSEKQTDIQPPGDADWVPGSENFRGDWRSKGNKSVAEDQPPLQAEPNVTALSGLALTLLGQPLAGVTIRVDGRSTKTDNTGRFLLTSISSGRRVMIIDGRSASRPGKTYGTFKVGVNITSDKTNVLPYTIWMPRLDMAHAVTLTSPTTGETVITNPLIPGLELRLPAGTAIRDMDGNIATQISITPVPTDRPPFPLPNGFQVPVFASIQPGGATLIPPRARLIYPNYTNQRPGARINFWNYDAQEKGWYVYGQGTVTPDGKQVVPDPGVVIYEFTGIMISGGGNPPPNGPNGGNGPRDGDPVDLGTGLFVLEKTDVYLQDTMPIALTRTYRPGDNQSRAFGIGATHPYDMFLWSVNNYHEADLILPDGGRIHFVRISPGTGFTNAVYEHTSTPSVFYKSQLFWNGNGWDLKLKDGTVYVFADFAPLQSVRDRYGNQVSITRSGGATGNIARLTSQNGRWIQFTYDTSDRITQATDNTGRVTTYTYDTGGRLWKVTNPKGGVTEYTYDTSNRMLTIKDARGIVFLTNEYNTAGRVTKQTQADATTYQFAYTLDANGKVTQTDVTDPRGNVRRVTFNSSGYMLSETFALGTSVQQQFTYEREAGSNLLSSTTDPLGHKTSFTYDSMGNALTVTRLAGTAEATTTTFTYESAFNQIASVTDPLSHTASFAYDAKGSLTSITDALGHQATFSYNAFGQPVSVTDALQNTTQLSYFGGDLASITNPLTQTTTQFVDSAGRIISRTNPLGHTTRYEYDAMNLLTKVTDPLSGVTTFAYDANGNLSSLTDARNNVTSYTYNNMDRKTARTDPLLHSEAFEYDAAGNLTKFTDLRGKVTTYTYDNLDRLNFTGFGTTGTSYESTTTYSFDGADRVTGIVDSISGTITQAYDNFDRLTSETTPQGVVSYTYDSANRRTGMTVAGQTAVSYTYDNANRLTAVTQGSSTVSLGYDAADRRTSLTLPNGVVTEYAYNALSQLTGLTYKKDTTVIGNLTYEYDADGHRSKAGGSFARTNFPDVVSSATYNAANQQTAFNGQTLTYDANGNLLNDGTNTYTWDARNQLATISGPSLTASFQYDGLGRRTAKTVNGQTTNYLYDDANLVQELSGATAVANFLNGFDIDEVFTRTDATSTQAFIADGLGSTIALLDSTGTVQTQYTYDPFGKTTTSGVANGNNNHFTGRENDPAGLYFYRARYYSPKLHRFISIDPLGFLAGDPNLYAYVFNSPTNFTDPSGEQVAELTLTGAEVGSFGGPIGTIAGAIIGAGIGLGLGYLLWEHVVEPSLTQPYYEARQHDSTRKGKKNWDKHTKPRPGRPNTKDRLKPDWKPRGKRPPGWKGPWPPKNGAIPPPGRK
jgi:RHS repeat-associated protein